MTEKEFLEEIVPTVNETKEILQKHPEYFEEYKREILQHVKGNLYATRFIEAMLDVVKPVEAVA